MKSRTARRSLSAVPRSARVASYLARRASDHLPLIVEVTLPEDTPVAGRRVGSITWPRDVALVAILRGPRVLVPTADDPLEPSDELLFISAPEMEPALHDLLATAQNPPDQDRSDQDSTD